METCSNHVLVLGITSVLVHPSGGVTSFAGSDPPQVITGTTPPNFYEYLYSIAPGAIPTANGMTAAGLIQLPQQRSDTGVQLQPFLQRVIQSPVPSIQSRSTVLALPDYAHTNDISKRLSANYSVILELKTCELKASLLFFPVCEFLLMSLMHIYNYLSSILVLALGRSMGNSLSS